MKAGAIRQGSVNERLTDIHPSPGGLQHPLDQVSHHHIGETQRHALGHPATCDEYPVSTIYPDLLDTRVIEKWLQGPKPADRRQHVSHAGGLVVNRRVATRQREV